MEYIKDRNLWSKLLDKNGYDLVSILDSGSFSDVFKVKIKDTGKMAAVKRLVARRNIREEPSFTAELTALRTLSSIRGSGVVKLLDSVVVEDR